MSLGRHYRYWFLNMYAFSVECVGVGSVSSVYRYISSTQHAGTF